MPILFKSSNFETYLYYFIFPLVTCISIFFIIGILSYGNLSLFLIIMVIIFSFAIITSIESFLLLKIIEVNEDGILIKNINNKKMVNFKDVVYVYNLININGTSVVVWYRDIKTNKLKVILIRPERENPPINDKYSDELLGRGELQITKFIKEKAMKSNTNYLNIDNPRWFLFSISPTFKFFK